METTTTTTIEAGQPLTQQRARLGVSPSPSLPRALGDRCPTCNHPVFEHRLYPDPAEFDSFEAWRAFLRRCPPGCVLCRCARTLWPETLWEPGPADYAEFEQLKRLSDRERDEELRAEG